MGIKYRMSECSFCKTYMQKAMKIKRCEIKNLRAKINADIRVLNRISSPRAMAKYRADEGEVCKMIFCNPGCKSLPGFPQKFNDYKDDFTTSRNHRGAQSICIHESFDAKMQKRRACLEFAKINRRERGKLHAVIRSKSNRDWFLRFHPD